MFAYLRREHALSAQLLLGGERMEQQYRAACRIQAMARACSARTRVAGKLSSFSTSFFSRIVLSQNHSIFRLASSEEGNVSAAKPSA